MESARKVLKAVPSSDDVGDYDDHEDEGEMSDESDDEAVAPTSQRSENCDSLKIMQGILNRRLHHRVRATERRDRTCLRKMASRGRIASQSVRTKRVRHPSIHGEHSRGWKKTRRVKGEELATVDEYGIDVDGEVEYVGVKLASSAPQAKRHKK